MKKLQILQKYEAEAVDQSQRLEGVYSLRELKEGYEHLCLIYKLSRNLLNEIIAEQRAEERYYFKNFMKYHGRTDLTELEKMHYEDIKRKKDLIFENIKNLERYQKEDQGKTFFPVFEKLEKDLENHLKNKNKGEIDMKKIIEMIEEVLVTKPLIEEETIEEIKEKIEETEIEREIELESVTIKTRAAEYYEAEDLNQHPRNCYSIKILGYNPGEDYLDIYDGDAFDYIEFLEEDDIDKNDPESIKEYIGEIEEAAAVFDLYEYRHGGSSFSTKPYGCPFDSGLVGIIIIEEYEDPQNIKNIIEDLNYYVNPTGYTIEILDSDGVIIESTTEREKPETLLELLENLGILEEIIEKEAIELERKKEIEKIRKLFRESKSDIGRENIIERKIEELLLKAETGLGDRVLKVLNEIRQIEKYTEKEIEKEIEKIKGVK